MNKNIKTIKDPNGNSIVFINEIIFKGRKKTDWKYVEDYLYQHIGEVYSVKSTGDMIYIGDDFPEEYTHSNYKTTLNRKFMKVKANLITGIPKLIEEANGKKYKPNKKEKHSRDAKFGWYRFISRFALPVYDEKGNISRYNLFKAELLVKHSSNNKMYLYDIINITQI